jgi:hypothetical protein
VSAANKALVISNEKSEKLKKQTKYLKDELECTIASMEKKHLYNTEVLKEKVCHQTIINFNNYGHIVRS